MTDLADPTAPIVKPDRPQFERAMEAAKLAGKSGVYVLRPRALAHRRLFKFGHTANASSRFFGEYNRNFPRAGGSYELHAFLVTGATVSHTREQQILRMTRGAHGFRIHPGDVEWREAVGVPAGDELAMQQLLVDLLVKARRTVDGHWFVFDREGAIARRGGRQGEVDPDRAIRTQYYTRTRAARRRGDRLVGAKPVWDRSVNQYMDTIGTYALRSARPAAAVAAAVAAAADAPLSATDRLAAVAEAARARAQKRTAARGRAPPSEPLVHPPPPPEPPSKHRAPSQALTMQLLRFLYTDPPPQRIDGLMLDPELSTADTRVYAGRDERGADRLIVAHRGTATLGDALEDAKLAVGLMREGTSTRLANAVRITKAAEAKYGRSADAIGHSLGGYLAEHSGASGMITTLNKAAGPLQASRAVPDNQIDYRTQHDLASIWAAAQHRSAGNPLRELPGDPMTPLANHRADQDLAATAALAEAPAEAAQSAPATTRIAFASARARDRR